MTITCTTVAGATAVISQFKRNIITKLKELADYKEFFKQVMTYIKGPSDIVQIQL